MIVVALYCHLIILLLRLLLAAEHCSPLPPCLIFIFIYTEQCVKCSV